MKMIDYNLLKGKIAAMQSTEPEYAFNFLNNAQNPSTEWGCIDDMLDSMEVYEAEPVKHGEWDFQGYQLFKCTNCKEIFTQNQLEAMQNHINQEEFTFPNFCPNCGADMRGDTNE